MCSLYLAVLIQHSGLKIHPRCYNTAVHSFSLPYSIMFREYATIYFSISTVDKPLRCFHLFPIMNSVAMDILIRVSQNTMCTYFSRLYALG